MLKLIFTAALGLTAMQPLAAQAQESEVYVVTIPAGDLNLASPAGAEALRGRALQAARQTCGESDRLEDLYLQGACIANFMHQVETRIASAAIPVGHSLAAR